MQAENIASKTKGVVEVENNIIVSEENLNEYGYPEPGYYIWNSYYAPGYVQGGAVDKSRFELKNDIQSQLWWSPYVNEDDVEVEVRGDTTILEGTVETEREKLYAEINALEAGAEEIENNIVVLYTP